MQSGTRRQPRGRARPCIRDHAPAPKFAFPAQLRCEVPAAPPAAAPAKLQSQASEHSVLLHTVPSLGSTESGGDEAECTQEMRLDSCDGKEGSVGEGEGVRWRADIAALVKCLTVTSLASNACSEAATAAPAKGASAPIEGSPGEQNFPYFTEVAKPEGEPPRPAALPGMDCLAAACSSGCRRLPGAMLCGALPEEAIPSCTSCQSCLDTLPDSRAASPACNDASGDRPAEAQKDGAPPPPPQLLPIMVFDSGANGETLQSRMREWAADIGSWNAAQAHLRLVSGGEFVPLDTRCPVVKGLLWRAGLYPQTLVSAAARFQELLLALPELGVEALGASGIWQFGQVAVMGPDGKLQVLGYKPESMTLAHASPRLRVAFVACAFHEANRMDSGPPFEVHSVTLEGIFAAPRPPRYSLLDLQEWLCIALGSQVGLESTREAAAVAARVCRVVDRAVIVA